MSFLLSLNGREISVLFVLKINLEPASKIELTDSRPILPTHKNYQKLEVSTEPTLKTVKPKSVET